MDSQEVSLFVPVSLMLESYGKLRSEWAEETASAERAENVWSSILSTRSRDVADLRSKVDLLLELLVEDLPPDAGALALAQSLRRDLSGDQAFSFALA